METESALCQPWSTRNAIPASNITKLPEQRDILSEKRRIARRKFGRKRRERGIDRAVEYSRFFTNLFDRILANRVDLKPQKSVLQGKGRSETF
jgi:hypothetical protein